MFGNVIDSLITQLSFSLSRLTPLITIGGEAKGPQGRTKTDDWKILLKPLPGEIGDNARNYVMIRMKDDWKDDWN